MPKYEVKYDQHRLSILAELRENVELSQGAAAQYFGTERNAVGNWEMGYSRPHKRRRPDFIIYLLDMLGLRRDQEQFQQLWNNIMVEVWEWEPLNSEELSNYFPGQARVISSDPATIPLFLAPSRPIYKLVGRNDLLHSLKQRLLAGDYVALSGLPGVGKTTLITALAHDRQIQMHFRDGVLWVGLGPKADILSHLGVWGEALGISSDEMIKKTSIEERAKAIQRAIGTRHLLLVVDDAWSVEAALAFKLVGPNCAYIVTTRFPEIALRLSASPTTVRELNKEDSLQLLTQLAPEVVKLYRDEVEKLVQAVDGLPLALTLIGNQLRIAGIQQSHRLSEAFDKLKQAEERLQLSESQAPSERHPGLPAGVKLSMKTIIAISDEALDETARHALRALSVFAPKPHTFSKEAALAVANTPINTLDQLYDYGLLESTVVYVDRFAERAFELDSSYEERMPIGRVLEDRYTLHQVIADYAREQLGSNYEPFQRHAEFYLNFMKERPYIWHLFKVELGQIEQAAYKVVPELGNEQLTDDYEWEMMEY